MKQTPNGTSGLVPGSEDAHPLLTIEEAAHYLRVSRSLAYQMANVYLDTGGIDGMPEIRFGSCLRVPRWALVELATTGTVVQPLRLLRLAGHYGRAVDRTAEVRQRMAEAGLGSFADRILALAMPALSIAPATDGAEGRSQLGGDPLLPDGFEWPSYLGIPFSFIAQVDLAEATAVWPESPLPKSGLLSFFYDSDQRVWGFDPKQVGSHQVSFFSPDEVLIRTVAPAHSEHVRFPGLAIAFAPTTTFAPWSSGDIDKLGLSDEQMLAYDDCRVGSGVTRHLLLGHPDPVQGDMQYESQLVSHGIYCGGGQPKGWRVRRLGRHAHRWRLLLQIDTDDNLDMMWGDCGRIYWWMHEDDLRACRWERAHMILQCS